MKKKVINKYRNKHFLYCWQVPPKNIFEKIKKGIQKRRISCWFQKCWKSCTKMYQKKVINQNVSEISIFQLLLKIQKLYLLITFNRGIVLKIFQHIWNQREILGFFIPISIFSTTKNCGHISTFCKLSSQMQPKQLKITKNVFY